MSKKEFYPSRGSNRKFLGLVAVICVLLAFMQLSGCIRYTAPRSELDEDSESSGEGNSLGSAEDFKAYEKRLTERLTNLTKNRAPFRVTGADTTYRIGPSDVLSVTVFGFSDLSTDADVSAEGTISLPMIGDAIPAAGQTISELQTNLSKRFNRFVRTPRVQVTVKQYQANNVSVVGEVSKPGVYPLKRNGQELLEIISLAGGRTGKASGRIVLMPASSSTHTSGSENGAGVEIAFDDLIGNVDVRPIQIPLLAGDTIIVPEAGSVEVYGEVEKPGSYDLASRTSALGAIASAGGFTYAAKVDEVEIIRDIGGGKRASTVLNLEDIALKGFRDTRLRDGDVIRVPSESGSFFRRQIVDAINGTFRGVGVNR